MRAGWAATILALVMALIGIVLTIGGVWLAALGGSIYYLIAGLALLASAWFLIRGRLLGGLRLRIGGAEVSPKHANFIVNLGGATASDINAVIREVQTRVHAAHDVWLHPEVVGLGLTVGHER